MRPGRRIATWGRAHLDVLLAVAIAIELELECWLDAGFAGARPTSAVAIVLFAAPIAWRRRQPVGALACSSLILTIQAPLGGELYASSGVSTLLGLALLAYSVGERREGPPGLLGLALAAVLFAGLVTQAA